MYTKKITSFCQVLKEMHTKENWLLFSASRCICLCVVARAQKGRVQIAAAMLSGNSLRQTVHTHRASVHQAAKLLAALLRVARVTAGLAESNDSLPMGL